MPNFLVKIIYNPLIWIGILLSYITLREVPNSEDIILMLKEPKYYIELFIGAVIYVYMFEKHYTKKREKVAILPNIIAIIDTMFIVFITWICMTLAVLYFQYRGERISRQLRQKYNEQRIANENTPAPTGMLIDASSALKGLEVEVGKKYIITIHSPDSVSIENFTPQEQ
jgi:hypothetical protein